MNTKKKVSNYNKRKARTNNKVKNVMKHNPSLIRCVVNKSNKFTYCSFISSDGNILLGGKSSGIKKGVSKTDDSKEFGSKIASEAQKKGIKKIIFDRNGYLYHGRIASLAEGLREGGLQF